MLFPWAKKKQEPQEDQRNVRLKWVLNYWVASVGQQFEASAALLGSHKEEAALKAFLCEIGLLHLYLIDHDIRQEHPYDPYLTSFLTSLIELVQEMNPTYLVPQQAYDFATARFRGYDDAVTTVDVSDTGNYFQALSSQFWSFLVADLTRGGRAFLYPGQVPLIAPDETVSAAEQAETVGLLRQVRDLLLPTALPLYFAARLWAQESVVYEKPVEELKRLALEGHKQAEAFLQIPTTGTEHLQRVTWWHNHLRQQTLFVLPSEDQLLYDETIPGVCYRRLQLASGSEGKPLHRFALAAYDDVMGLSAVDPKTGTLMVLTLGEVIALLQTGSPLQTTPFPTLDWEGILLRTSPASKWRLCASTRRLIQRYYAQQEQTPLIGWVEDNDGHGILTVAPEVEHSEDVLAFGVSVNLMAAPVGENNGAQFDLWDIGPDSQLVQLAMEDRASDLSGWQEQIDQNRLFFRPSGTFLYGYAGMPFELIYLSATQEGGRPLREVALGCYDNSRCLAVVDADNPTKVSWFLTITDIAHLLQTGQLTPPKNPAYREMRGGLDPAFTPRPVNSLVLPRASQGDIRWTLIQYGSSGTGCVMRSTSGQTVLVLDCNGMKSDAIAAVQARLRYSVPPDVLTTLAPLPEPFQLPFYDS